MAKKDSKAALEKKEMALVPAGKKKAMKAIERKEKKLERGRR